MNDGIFFFAEMACRVYAQLSATTIMFFILTTPSHTIITPFISLHMDFYIAQSGTEPEFESRRMSFFVCFFFSFFYC